MISLFPQFFVSRLSSDYLRNIEFTQGFEDHPELFRPIDGFTAVKLFVFRKEILYQSRSDVLGCVIQLEVV